MNTPRKNIYTADDIHKMRVATAEKYSRMTPDEAALDFNRCVEEAEKTMETLRKEKRLAMN